MRKLKYIMHWEGLCNHGVVYNKLSNSLCLGHRSPDAHTWDARICAFRTIQAQCTRFCLCHNRVVVAAAQPARECSRLRADRERTLLVLARPPHRIERNPFDRDGKGLTEEFCESKSITLRKLFYYFYLLPLLLTKCHFLPPDRFVISILRNGLGS